MIKSMTAFARNSAQGEWGSASFEIKTVNHRYLDSSFRLPDMVRDLEMPMRELIREAIQRGKVDCALRYTLGNGVQTDVVLNQTLVQQLIVAATEVEQQLPTHAKFSALDVLRWPGAMQVADTDVSAAQKPILALVKAVLQELNVVREREGKALTVCILERLTDLEQQVALVRPKTKEVIIQQRKKLQERMTDLALKIDDARVEQEIVLLAQRLDVTEELDRLTTHLDEVRRVLKQGGAVGRRLDFLMQELNREANTLGSKSIDTEMTQAAVEMKVLIEQMREQIQNVE